MIRLLLPALLLALPLLAQADCTSPAGKRGQFQINGGYLQLCDGTAWISASRTVAGTCTTSGRIFWNGSNLQYCAGTDLWTLTGTNNGTCPAGMAGMIRFDDSSTQLQFCSGSNWVATAESGGDPCAVADPPVGQVCQDGSIFVGKFKVGTEMNQYKYFVTPAGCTSASNCPGGSDTITRYWDSSGTTNVVGIEDIGSASTRSTQSGDYITPLIPGSGNAATFCGDMTFGGKTDWFLPAKSEMAFLFCNATTTQTTNKPDEDQNCATYRLGGGTVASSFQASGYWTASEASTANAWTITFPAGTQVSAAQAKTGARYFRCMRRTEIIP